MTRRALLVGLALAGCTADRPNASAGAARLLKSAVPDAAVAAAFVGPPPTFVRELGVSEAAASEVGGGPAKHLCALLNPGDRGRALGALADGFRGRFVGPAEPTAFGDGGVEVTRRPATDATLEPEPFLDAFAALGSGLSVVESCKLKPFRFKLAEPGRDKAYVELLLYVLGRDARGRGVELRAEARAEARVVSEGGEGSWRFTRFAMGDVEAVAATQRFHDVSAAAGVGLYRGEAASKGIAARTNAAQLETIGGVAVVDFDHDGLEDVLAWNRRSVLLAFLNDGAGGFRKLRNPIPADAVGFFQLFVDLDGDGAEELVSTEVRCVAGRPALGLFAGAVERWRPVPGALSFADRCSRLDDLEYQALVPVDVDRDGDLDLFAAGYRNRLSKTGEHNLFQAHDGQRNLLFLNEGGLRFREVSADRGLADNAFSYAATFFDADLDGDQDLFVVNDFGVNQLWLNDGTAHFKPGAGPLAANGQSMGITVADLDGDLDLDVYVSNMFSKAGNRIVPLLEGVLAPDVWRTLFAIAQGNTLYRREEDGSFTEVAHEQGVAHAGWAWGHAVFDADNDADLDIYVANGMTSHENKAAPDF